MWSHSTAGPRSLARSGSSFHELYLSYRVRTASNLPRTSPCEAPPLEFPSPSRHQFEESTCERASQAHPTVRPQRFSRSRRFAPLRTLRVYFTPQPRPGFTFQGFSPAAKSDRLVGDPCPLVVLRLAPTAELPRRHRIEPPHLQGFAPGSDSKPPTG
jgi:hypothetical protein